jgi:hypothetical protein
LVQSQQRLIVEQDEEGELGERQEDDEEDEEEEAGVLEGNAPVRSQFHQHYMRGFCANIFVPKKLKPYF